MKSNTERYKDIITLLDEKKIKYKFWNDVLYFYDTFIEVIFIEKENNYYIYLYSISDRNDYEYIIKKENIKEFITKIITSDEVSNFKSVDYNNMGIFLKQLDKLIVRLNKE